MSHDDENRMSTKQKLVYMANQIATFFDSKPHDERVEGIAEHINKFWDPRMRRQFLEMLAAGGAGMKPTVIEAGAKIRPPKQDAA
ncbi:MAG: formate dehydrogenase [Mesorhizobium sp. SCN 65-20]|nr:MAG: formate dehydrogenase [Mesorhizobium sp. SCN 65-20]